MKALDYAGYHFEFRPNETYPYVAVRGQQPVIVRAHSAVKLIWAVSGWGISTLDSLDVEPCGCISTPGRSVHKCQIHLAEEFACCPLAIRVPCLCTAAHRCTVHGERHHGSHD